MKKFKSIEELASEIASTNAYQMGMPDVADIMGNAMVSVATEAWKELEVMDFSQALLALKSFECIRRRGWNGKGLIVFRQVPASIPTNIIPTMQSVPDAAKKAILGTAAHIGYTSQCLIYNTFSGRADSWVPSVSDMLADDWEVVEFDGKPICQA